MRVDLDDELCTWPDEPLLFTRANATDQWPEPITPLTQELVWEPCERGVALVLSESMGLIPSPPLHTMQGCFWGWVYNGIDYSATAMGKLPGYSRQMAFEQYLALPRDPALQPEPPTRLGVREMARVVQRFIRSSRQYPKDAQRYRQIAESRLEIARARDWTAVPDDELMALLRTSAEEWPRWRLPLYVSALLSGVGIGQLMKLTAKYAADEDGSLARQMIAGVGGIEMTELIKMADVVASGEASINTLINRFGYRGPNEYELAAPTWEDDRGALERLVETARGRKLSRQDLAASEREQARSTAKQRSGSAWPLFVATCRWLEPQLRWRENAKVHEVMHAACQRLAVREAGRRLADDGTLATSDDVFLLRRRELMAGLTSRADVSRQDVVSRRREVREAARNLQLPAMVEARPGGLGSVPEERIRALGLMPSRGTPPDVGRDVLVGEGVSAGEVIGPANVVSDPYEADLVEGDVLVACTTDPAWTPLFAQVAAVVVDNGGLLSHGAMVAREFGIPCVVNIPGASRRIKTGMILKVDGSTGRVVIVG